MTNVTFKTLSINIIHVLFAPCKRLLWKPSSVSCIFAFIHQAAKSDLISTNAHFDNFDFYQVRDISFSHYLIQPQIWLLDSKKNVKEH